MKLLYTLADHYIDAFRALNDGVVLVNGEVQYSAHREVQPGDVVEITADIVKKWTVE